MKAIAAFGLLLLAAPCLAGSGGGRPEILGLHLGMSQGDAHGRLKALGRLEKEEKRRQEVWKLEPGQPYAHLIVAFDKERARIRFVTAVAHDQGPRIRYRDVVDTRRARLDLTPASRTYTLRVPAKGGRPAYVIRAIGSDPTFLKYYSIENAD